MMQLSMFENDFRQHKKYQQGVIKSRQEIEWIAKKEGRNKIYHVLSFGRGTQYWKSISWEKSIMTT